MQSAKQKKIRHYSSFSSEAKSINRHTNTHIPTLHTHDNEASTLLSSIGTCCSLCSGIVDTCNDNICFFATHHLARSSSIKPKNKTYFLDSQANKNLSLKIKRKEENKHNIWWGKKITHTQEKEKGVRKWSENGNNINGN